MLWNTRILAFDDLLVQALHVVSSERRHQGAHLVEDTAEGPDVRLRVVRHVPPNLWRGVVRSAGLGVRESFLHDLRDVEVSELRLHVSVEEDVGRLHIAVQDLPIMQSFEASYDLDEDIPYFLLFDVGFAFLITADLLKDVAIVSVLHHKTKARAGLVYESLLVGYDVLMVDAGQNSDLVQCILLLFVGEV